MSTDSDELIQRLIEHYQLEPLPLEGGYFAQTYRSSEMALPGELPARYTTPHPFGTAILYLLTPAADCFSALHSLPTDEIYHFYLGDPVEMLLLSPQQSEHILLGQDVFGGEQIQLKVPGGVWQGSRLRRGGRFALLGATMAPGYVDEDYAPGERSALLRQYPEESELIRALTRE